MGKKITIYCKSETQWLPFAEIKGGVAIKKGNNKLDMEIWEKVRESKWVRHLLKGETINVVKKEVDKNSEDQVKEEMLKMVETTEDIEELQGMLEKTPSSSIKTRITRKIKRLLDGE